MMGRTPVPYITGGVGNDAGENDSGQKTSLPPASHAESPGGSGERLRSLGGGSSLELQLDEGRCQTPGLLAGDLTRVFCWFFRFLPTI